MESDLRYDVRTEKLISEIARPKTLLGKIYRLVPEGVNLLDVGCHTGGLGRLLQEKRCKVTGLEKNPQAAEKARAALSRVVVGDIEDPAIFDRLGNKFDAILFLDVLEHCQDPGWVLKKARACLAPNGFVLCSIPNIAHWTMRKNLLLGRFNYQSTGILDESHLRFFTIATARALFLTAGYETELVDGFLKPPKLLKQKIIPLAVARRFPGLFAYQIIVKAKPNLAGGADARGAPSFEF